MKNRQPRVLYFTKGPKPTEREVVMAQSLSSNIGYRYSAGAKALNIESDVDAVAGIGVPPNYREKGIRYVTTAAQALAAAARREVDTEEFDPDAEHDPDADQSGEADQLEPVLNEDGTAKLDEHGQPVFKNAAGNGANGQPPVKW